MAHLGKFLHTKSGKLIMSIILGFGFASLFRRVCKDLNCTDLYAVPMQQLEQKIYQLGNQCVKFNYKATQCAAPNPSSTGDAPKYLHFEESTQAMQLM